MNTLTNVPIPDATTPPEQLLTQLQYNIKDTAKLLGVSVQTVRRLLKRRFLKANPAHRSKMIYRESILAFIKM
jgi:hypothetical protein